MFFCLLSFLLSVFFSSKQYDFFKKNCKYLEENLKFVFGSGKQLILCAFHVRANMSGPMKIKYRKDFFAKLWPILFNKFDHPYGENLP